MIARTLSAGIAGDPLIPPLLGLAVKKGVADTAPGDVIVGWGAKDNTRKARDFAAGNGLAYWCLEDGFLGYLSHPADDPRRLSLIVDKTGIYYDATAPSDLERLLNDGDWITDARLSRARAALERIRQWGLSKYNHGASALSSVLTKRISDHKGPVVLVVDQTAGDLSIPLGLASAQSFDAMLAAALDENPDALMLIKTHPDVLAGKKRGHYRIADLPERVLPVTENCTPLSLLNHVDRVYVVTSQMGFDALVAGKPVTCFGMPFYAGWGVTDDRQTCPRRTARRTLVELAAAALMEYARYVNPYDGRPCELEDALDLLVAERQLPRPEAATLHAVGFSLWKRGFVAHFTGRGIARVRFVTPEKLSRHTVGPDDAVLVWGRKHDDSLAGLDPAVPVWRMEDGFIRSVGLGSDLARPASLILDRSGIYYDGRCPSDLETFLKTHLFSDRDLARGEKLIGMIRESRISKYNVGSRARLDWRGRSGGRTVILVPGQVDSDASIRFGAVGVASNADLLQAVRASEPDAFIVFKPHPDVVSGNRRGAVPDDVLAACVDTVIVDADIVDCLDAADAVHTMTSLTGFEALLRDMPVTVYGLPFYAGWGLTEDRAVCDRRGRTLPLAALVYALLAVYARNVDWRSGLPTSPEVLVAAMASAAAHPLKARRGAMDQLMRLIRKFRFFMHAALR